MILNHFIWVAYCTQSTLEVDVHVSGAEDFSMFSAVVRLLNLCGPSGVNSVSIGFHNNVGEGDDT